MDFINYEKMFYSQFKTATGILYRNIDGNWERSYGGSNWELATDMEQFLCAEAAHKLIKD